MRKYQITLDVYKRQAFYIEFSSLDTDNILEVSFQEKGIPIDISESIITLTVNEQVITGEINENKAIFNISPALTIMEGVVTAQIGIYNNGALTSLHQIPLNISEGVGNIDLPFNGFESPNLANEILLLLSEKVDKNTLNEIIDLIGKKVDKETGKLSELINDGDGQSPYATYKELMEEIAKLVDSSPEALNTLNELARALGNDANFASTVLNLLGNKTL